MKRVVGLVGALLLGCPSSHSECAEGSMAICRCADEAVGLQLCREGIFDPCACGDAGILCVPGQRAACRCTSGASGTVLCGSDGLYDECLCDALDAGLDAGLDGGFDAGRDAGRDAGPPIDAPPGDASCLECVATILDLRLTDLAVEPARGVLLGTVSSSASSHGNELVRIDPETGEVIEGVYVGSQPGPLAVASDGSFAYVGLAGAGSVRRVDLASFTAGLEFPLADTGSGPMRAVDIAVLPDRPHSVLVSLRGASYRAVAVFDDGVMRSSMAPVPTGASRIEVESATRAWGYEDQNTEFGFRQLTLSPAGVAEDWMQMGLVDGFTSDIVLHDGEIYATTGVVIDPAARRLRGTFDATGRMAFEEGSTRVYFAVQDRSGTTTALAAFDRSTFLQIRSVPAYGLWAETRRIFRFGVDGFALLVGGGRLALVHRPDLVAE